jgi:hypothetical protein
MAGYTRVSKYVRTYQPGEITYQLKTSIICDRYTDGPGRLQMQPIAAETGVLPPLPIRIREEEVYSIDILGNYSPTV